MNKEKDGEHHDKELRQDQEIEKEESDVAIREEGDGSVREELGEMVKSNSITLTPSLQDSKKSEVDYSCHSHTHTHTQLIACE